MMWISIAKQCLWVWRSFTDICIYQLNRIWNCSQCRVLCNVFTYLKDIRIFSPTFRYSSQSDMLICQVGRGHQIQHWTVSKVLMKTVLWLLEHKSWNLINATLKDFHVLYSLWCIVNKRCFLLSVKTLLLISEFSCFFFH